MSTQQLFRSFALTVRPRDGVSDDHVTKMVKWCKRHCDYYHVVTEKTGHERHLHVGLFLKSPKTKSNIGVMMKCLYKDLENEEKKVLLKGIAIMYNADFIENYLDKDDDTVVIESCLPEAKHMEGYFPPKPKSTDTRARKCSAYYHELEHLWFEHVSPHMEINTVTARDFLFKMMYSERCLAVIRDDKQIAQVARHLVRWLNKAETSTIELAPFEKEE